MCYLAAEDLFPNHIRTYSQADYVFVTRTAQRYRSLAQGYLTTLFKKNNNNGTGDVHATQCAPVESSCILRHFDLILVTYCSIAQIWLHYLHWVPQICKKTEHQVLLVTSSSATQELQCTNQMWPWRRTKDVVLGRQSVKQSDLKSERLCVNRT